MAKVFVFLGYLPLPPNGVDASRHNSRIVQVNRCHPPVYQHDAGRIILRPVHVHKLFPYMFPLLPIDCEVRLPKDLPKRRPLRS